MTAREVLAIAIKDLKPGGIRWLPVPLRRDPLTGKRTTVQRYAGNLRRAGYRMGLRGYRFTCDEQGGQVAVFRQF